LSSQTPDYALIFDFDGVLFESEQLHCEALAQTLAEIGVRVDWAEYAERYVGLSDQEIFGRLIQFHPELDDLDHQAALDRKWRRYESLTQRGVPPIDGVGELLARLRRDAIPTAICSGSRRSEITRLLAQADLSSSFEVLVSTEDVSASKPSPEGYLLALERLRMRLPSLRAGQCVVVEDSAAGLAAAGSAGMPAVALRKEYGDVDYSSPIVSIGALDELTAAMLLSLIQDASS